jgi:hypothetical protein
LIPIIGFKDLVSTVKLIRVRVCGKWEINIECMFLWIKSYGLNRKPWACACTSHFLLFLCFCFIVVALVFYNFVLCFLLFVLYIDDYVILQLFSSSLVAQLSFFYLTFLLHSFCWTLTLHSIAHLYSLISHCFVIVLLFNLSFFSALSTMLAPWLSFN